MYSRSAPRRRHSAAFKAKVLADCDQSGASISGVALAHGLNANLVRQWRAGRGVKLAGMNLSSPAVCKAPKPTEGTASPLLARREFVAIEMPRAVKPSAGTAVENAGALASADPLIHIEIRRGTVHLDVRWPTSAANDCTAWLRELTAGLLK